jgi:hypothetical protein
MPTSTVLKMLAKLPCRVANFCTKSVDMIDMTSFPVDEHISVLVTRMKAEGWRENMAFMRVYWT